MPVLPAVYRRLEFECRPAGWCHSSPHSKRSQLHEYHGSHSTLQGHDTGAVIGRAKDLAPEMIATIPDAFEYHTSRRTTSQAALLAGLFRCSHPSWATRAVRHHRTPRTNLIRTASRSTGRGASTLTQCRCPHRRRRQGPRSLAFANSRCRLKHRQYDKHDNLRIMIPRSVVIATTISTNSSRNNGLKYHFAGVLDEESSQFVARRFPSNCSAS